jgi:peptidoglycan/xylan/chitin deacetylase (PgdA/CDA1 family)
MSPRALLKSALALGMSATGLDRLLLALQKTRRSGHFIRLVNSHDTPRSAVDAYRRQLAFYARHFAAAGPADLARLLTEGRWDKPRPGLILTFDDGLRSNYDVAAPLLEEVGFVGWFFLPVGFPDTPAGRQAAFARSHQIQAPTSHPSDGRIAMSWDEARDLVRRGHVVGCHTRTHHRLGAETPPERLDDEIATAKSDLEQRLGGPVEHFCWVGGEERSYSRSAAERIRAAGYRYGWMACSAPCTAATDPLHLHRTNIEATWPLRLVRLQLSGLADRANAAKRRRVDALTAVGPE